MRIIIPTFEEIRLMPPTITLFNVLADMGYEVIYITIFPDSYSPNFKSNLIKNVPLFKRNVTLSHNAKIPNIVGVRGAAFRIDLLIKKLFARRLSCWLSKNFKKDDLLWVVNEMTPLLAGSAFTKKFKDQFIFTIYELHNSTWATRHIKKTAQNAKVNVVVEYNRAHIQKYFFGLKQLPLILPNKPLNLIEGKNLPIDDRNIKLKIDQIKKSGKKIIIYMGIIGLERPLENLISAVKNLKDKYELVVLGRPSTYLDYLKQHYNGYFTYLGFVSPPQHINIASHADIGVLIYVPQGDIGLNAIYCAPNKIYEYTGVGLPILTNDIPGLNEYIHTYKCGVSIDLDNIKDISEKLEMVFDNYANYQQGAYKLYHDIDVKKTVKSILTAAGNEKI